MVVVAAVRNAWVVGRSRERVARHCTPAASIAAYWHRSPTVAARPVTTGDAAAVAAANTVSTASGSSWGVATSASRTLAEAAAGGAVADADAVAVADVGAGVGCTNTHSDEKGAGSQDIRSGARDSSYYVESGSSRTGASLAAAFQHEVPEDSLMDRRELWACLEEKQKRYAVGSNGEADAACGAGADGHPKSVSQRGRHL